MKCKDCNCCRLGWYKSTPYKHVCIGVKHPFVIDDVNKECTEYPELNKKKMTNLEYIKNMNAENMAVFLANVGYVNEVCQNCSGSYEDCGGVEFCSGQIEKWLQSEKE